MNVLERCLIFAIMRMQAFQILAARVSAAALSKNVEIPIIRHQKVRGAGYLSNWTAEPQNWTQEPLTYGKCSMNRSHAEMLPYGTLCPSECMFVQEIQGDPCNQLCVPANACEDTHPGLQWANPETGLCEKPCGLDHEITGCRTCAGQGRCSECYHNFLLLDNGRRCEYVGAHYFRYVYTTIILIFLAVTVYMIALCTRPKINNEVKRQALRHRALCRVARHGRGPDGDSIWEPWSLNTNLSSEDVAGRGVALYFRWMIFLAVVALVLVIGTAIVYETSPYARQAPTDGSITTANCPDTVDPSSGNLAADKHILHRKEILFAQKSTFLEHWGKNSDTSTASVAISPLDRQMENAVAQMGKMRETFDRQMEASKQQLERESFSLEKAGMESNRQEVGHHQPKQHSVEVIKHAIDTRDELDFRDPLDPVTLSSEDGQPLEDPARYRHFSHTGSHVSKRDGAARSKEWTNDVQDYLEPLTETHKPKKHAAQKAYEEHHYRMFVFYASFYVLVFIATFVFIRSQFMLSNSWGRGCVGHSPYTLWVSGLPPELRCPTPLHNYMQQILQAQRRPDLGSVVGVSLAYDSTAYSEQIDEAISDWTGKLEKLEASQLRIVPNEQGQPGMAMSPTRSATPNVQADLDRESQKAQSFEFGFVDALILGEPVPTPGYQKKSPDTSWLREITGSGDAYVVLDTQEACLLLEEIFKRKGRMDGPQPFVFNDQRYVLEVRCIGQTEPPEVIWRGFHREALVRQILRMFACICLIALAITVFLVLYIPYAMYYNGLMQVPGVHVHFMHDFILGLLIGVGNAIVGKIIDIAANTASFRTKDGRDVTITTLSFFATFINVMTDLLMTAVIVKGLALTTAFEGNAIGHDRLLAQSLFHLIVPGYLFVPLVVVPMFQNFLPFYLGKAIVGSRNVPKALAEKSLEPPEFDVCWRYSDTLNNFCITLTLALLTSPYSWQVALCLLCYLLLVLLIDRYLLLRHSRATAYTTNNMSLTFACLWSVPTGGLAVLIAWWGWKAGMYTEQHPLSVVGACLCFHFLLYHSVLYFLWHFYLRNDALTRMRYTDTYVLKVKEGKPWTYFNTNHVFCLRSLYLPQHESGWDVIKLRHASFPRQDSACIPYICGKMHLQPGTAKNISEDLTRNEDERVEEAAAYQAEIINRRRQELDAALQARAQDAVGYVRDNAASAAARAEQLRAAGASRFIAAVEGGVAAVRNRIPGTSEPVVLTPEQTFRSSDSRYQY